MMILKLHRICLMFLMKILEASDEIQAELAVIKQNSYLPHEEYEKDVVNDEEDEAIKNNFITEEKE